LTGPARPRPGRRGTRCRERWSAIIAASPQRHRVRVGRDHARAKAEVVGICGDVGIAPRPERLLILSLGLALAALPWSGNPIGGIGNGNTWLALAVALITVLSAITVVQRIISVRRQLADH
jgi:hypothetical protein